MVQGYTARVRTILSEHGCVFVRHSKGDHEIWSCPAAKRPVVVDGRIMSRTIANLVLKQAGIRIKL